MIELSSIDWRSNLLENEFVWAALVGGLMVVARGVPSILKTWLMRRLTYSITACSEDILRCSGRSTHGSVSA